jgi:hypothetical protein
MVVVPYRHAAGHQRANARVLVEAGGARLVEDEAFDADALLEAAAILDDPARRRRMAEASKALGRPGAADAVAELVLAAAERRPPPDPERLDRLSRGETSSARVREGAARVADAAAPGERVEPSSDDEPIEPPRGGDA